MSWRASCKKGHLRLGAVLENEGQGRVEEGVGPLDVEEGLKHGNGAKSHLNLF
jgi:hypothetical protein